MPAIYKNAQVNDSEMKRKEEEAFMKQLERFDENVKHAILLHREKNAKSEFYKKLESLTDRIYTYQDIFYTKKPAFEKLNEKYASQNSEKIENSPPKKVYKTIKSLGTK